MAPGMTAYSGTPLPSTPLVWPEDHLFEIMSRRANQHGKVATLQAAAPPRRILVLGTGNPLRSDGGVGARTIETLQVFFEFSENVTFLRDWELCQGLLGALTKADAVVVIDAVRAGSRPGTLHRLSDGRVPRTLSDSDAPHQVRLADTLAVAEILGRRPETVIVAIEPEDTSSRSTQLTDTVELRIPDLVASVLREIERMGGVCIPKYAPPLPAFACDRVSA